MSKLQKTQLLELLGEQIKCLNEGRTLSGFDHEKFKKLCTQLSLLEDYTYWKNRRSYIKILDNFVNDKIIFDQFTKQFYKLKISDLKSHHMIKKNLKEIVSTNIL